MNIGAFTTPNTKGQIVIPKKMRDNLNITSQTNLHLIVKDGGIYIYPITDVVTTKGNDSAYLTFLEKTQGAWVGDSWDDQEQKSIQIERDVTKINKKAW